jgi:hypothetical protein
MVRSTCPGLSNRPSCVAFSCNGATLACGVLHSGVALFDTRSGSKKLELPGAVYVSKLVFSISRALFSRLSLVLSALLVSLPSPRLQLYFVFNCCVHVTSSDSPGCVAYPSLAPPLPLTPLSPIRSLLRLVLPRPGLLSRRRKSAGLRQWSGGACVGPALEPATEAAIKRCAGGRVVS